jgi:DNA-binding beta-propeller fold protein YncE
MTNRVAWPVIVGLLVGLVIGCQSTDSDGPGYTFADTWGGPGAEPGQFREPIGLAVTGTGEVFVGEAGGRRIQVFNQEGEVRRQIGPALEHGDTLRRPMHIAVRDSALYVPDYNTDHVHVLSHQGAPRRTLDASGLKNGLDAPGGVGVAAGGRIYVSDFYNHRVLRVHGDGTLDRQWGMADSAGTAPGHFTYPTDVAPLPDGGFVVADAYNHRIQRFTADDSVAWTRPSDQTWADSTTGTFNVATAVAAGPDGHIFVADFYNHRIQEFTPEGTFVRAVGEKGTGDGQFERPVDVDVGPDGCLYVVDLGNERIQVFTADP